MPKFLVLEIKTKSIFNTHTCDYMKACVRTLQYVIAVLFNKMTFTKTPANISAFKKSTCFIVLFLKKQFFHSIQILSCKCADVNSLYNEAAVAARERECVCVCVWVNLSISLWISEIVCKNCPHQHHHRCFLPVTQRLFNI